MTNISTAPIAPVVPALTIAQFNALPKGEQRVLIAQDVIEQINAELYVAKHNVYVKLDLDGYDDLDLSMDVKENFSKIESCNVCALGGLLMSATRFKNKVKFADIDYWDGNFQDSDNIKAIFKSAFTPKQLMLIELAFEGVSISDQAFALNAFNYEVDDLSQNEYNAAIAFRNTYHDDAKYNDEQDANILLLAIMQNIVDNKGVFKP